MPGIMTSRRIRSGGGEDRITFIAASWSVAACTRYSTFSSSWRIEMSSGVSSITRIVLLPFSVILSSLFIDESVGDLAEVTDDLHEGIYDLRIELGPGAFLNY